MTEKEQSFTIENRCPLFEIFSSLAESQTEEPEIEKAVAVKVISRWRRDYFLDLGGQRF